MVSKTDGYILDVPYLSIYFGMLNPLRLGLALNSTGCAAPIGPVGEYSYLELGCGPGSSVLVHAAANPQATFVGVDFNPEHIAAGNKLAQAAGLTNVTLLQASFADLLTKNPNLPDFDFIAAHGIWSWINAENRGHVKAIVDKKLKPGGALYLSYNVLPGNASVVALRDLMRFRCLGTYSSLYDQVDAGMQFAQKVCDAKALFFDANPTAHARLDQIKTELRTYLIHEYHGDNWEPFYHSAVARDLEPLGLMYAASAKFAENMDQWHFPPDGLKLIDAVAIDAEKETLKDYFLNRTFRTDLFLRGKADLGMADVVKRLTETRYALTIAPHMFKETSLETALGTVKPKGDNYQAFVDALGQGPALPRDVLARAGLQDMPPRAVFDMLVFLSSLGTIVPVLPPEGEAARKAAVARFNGAHLDLTVEGSDFPALASATLGGGVGVKFNEQLFLAAERRGEDPVQFTLKARARLIDRPRVYGQPWRDGKDSEAEIAAQYQTYLEKVRPQLTYLSVVI